MLDVRRHCCDVGNSRLVRKREIVEARYVSYWAKGLKTVFAVQDDAPYAPAPMGAIRQSVREHLELLAHPSKQAQYESSVPVAHVHGELVAGFCSDLFRPKSKEFVDAFSEDELKDLAHLYGLLMETGRLRVASVNELLKQPEWRRVVTFAKELFEHLR